jgi:integrase
MSVRKRGWGNSDGSRGETWVVGYTDQGGKRRLKSFNRKRDAECFEAAVNVGVRAGIHVPDSQSVMIAEAAKLWVASCEAAGLERATLAAYQQRVDLHIVPLIGAMRLSQLSLPAVRSFEDALRKDRSPAMVRMVISALGAILADAQDRGLIGQNVVRARPRRRHAGDQRQGKLKIGIDIPSPDEIRTIIAALDGRWRPLLLTAIFAGLRASELRGLRWVDIDLRRGELHVRQRADQYNTIGRLKSEAGERTVPLPPTVVNTLREWKLTCPKGSLDLVFPNGRGRVENYSNIIKRGLIPTLLAAGVVDGNGKAKYPGLHSLRHFYASWCINRRADGGLELPLKVVQARLGHASIQMTADVYGHLFPRGDDGTELAAAERAFLGG